jgi:hypothetical protein
MAKNLICAFFLLLERKKPQNQTVFKTLETQLDLCFSLLTKTNTKTKTLKPL